MKVPVSNGDGVRAWAARLMSMFLIASLAACTLPKAGPTKRQIYSGSVQREGDAFIIMDAFIVSLQTLQATSFDAI